MRYSAAEKLEIFLPVEQSSLSRICQEYRV
jgi:hypothetical protein